MGGRDARCKRDGRCAVTPHAIERLLAPIAMPRSPCGFHCSQVHTLRDGTVSVYPALGRVHVAPR